MKQYLDLLQHIKSNGEEKQPARDNMPNTTSIFGYQFRHNLQDGFPLLTTKEIKFEKIVIELLWFLKGDTNVKFLNDLDVNIWNEDAYNYYCKLCDEQHLERKLSFDLFISYIKNAKSIDELQFDSISNAEKDTIHALIPKGYILGDCGYQYGATWRGTKSKDIPSGILRVIKSDDITREQLDQLKEHWEKCCQDNKAVVINSNKVQVEYKQVQVDQVTDLINGLKNNPFGRRHIIDSINMSYKNDLALFWCHCLAQFNVRVLTLRQREKLFLTSLDYEELGNLDRENNEESFHKILDKEGLPKYYLDCQLYQRSADVFLGVPFNIASYSLLTHVIAKMCNMIPGDFIHTFGDVHIYDNHKDQINQQLLRQPTELPQLKLSSSIDWNSDIDSILEQVLKVGVNKSFEVQRYNPQPSIKGKLSTGLK